MNYYAALDVSLLSVHLCVMDENGDIQAEGQVDSEPEDIDAFLRKLDLEITTVGLEAGTLTQYLTYGLQAAGYPVVCMEARQVKVALSALRNKTDKNDAITAPLQPQRERPCVDVVWMKPNMTAVL